MADMNNTNGALDWNGTINKEKKNYPLLEEGDYDFTVVDFKQEYTKGGKLGVCPRAVLTYEVDTQGGPVRVTTGLLLHRSFMTKLVSFFECIGLKSPAEKEFRMAWDQVIGERGYGHFVQREYVGKDGTKKYVNDCDKYYPYDETRYANSADGFYEIPEEEDEELPF